jgi:hypothetical protein
MRHAYKSVVYRRGCCRYPASPIITVALRDGAWYPGLGGWIHIRELDNVLLHLAGTHKTTVFFFFFSTVAVQRNVECARRMAAWGQYRAQTHGILRRREMAETAARHFRLLASWNTERYSSRACHGLVACEEPRKPTTPQKLDGQLAYLGIPTAASYTLIWYKRQEDPPPTSRLLKLK